MKKLGVLLAAVLLTGLWAFPAHARAPLPDATTGAFVAETLEAINGYRARHGVPPVVLDPELADYARQRTRDVSRHERLEEAHRGLRPGTGENLFWAGSGREEPVPGPAAVETAYAEIGDYDFAAPGFSSGTGQFTQLVWKSTTHVGIARAAGWGEEWYETYIVVTFEPPGNVVGQFEENVLPPEG